MEWLYLTGFVLTWILYNKLRMFHKVERDRRWIARERRAARVRKTFEAQRRQRALLRLRSQRRRR